MGCSPTLLLATGPTAAGADAAADARDNAGFRGAASQGKPRDVIDPLAPVVMIRQGRRAGSSKDSSGEYVSTSNNASPTSSAGGVNPFDQAKAASNGGLTTGAALPPARAQPRPRRGSVELSGSSFSGVEGFGPRVWGPGGVAPGAAALAPLLGHSPNSPVKSAGQGATGVSNLAGGVVGHGHARGLPSTLQPLPADAQVSVSRSTDLLTAMHPGGGAGGGGGAAPPESAVYRSLGRLAAARASEPGGDSSPRRVPSAGHGPPPTNPFARTSEPNPSRASEPGTSHIGTNGGAPIRARAGQPISAPIVPPGGPPVSAARRAFLMGGSSSTAGSEAGAGAGAGGSDHQAAAGGPQRSQASYSSKQGQAQHNVPAWLQAIAPGRQSQAPVILAPMPQWMAAAVKQTDGAPDSPTEVRARKKSKGPGELGQGPGAGSEGSPLGPAGSMAAVAAAAAANAVAAARRPLVAAAGAGSMLRSATDPGAGALHPPGTPSGGSSSGALGFGSSAAARRPPAGGAGSSLGPAGPRAAQPPGQQQGANLGAAPRRARSPAGPRRPDGTIAPVSCPPGSASGSRPSPAGGGATGGAVPAASGAAQAAGAAGGGRLFPEPPNAASLTAAHRPQPRRPVPPGGQPPEGAGVGGGGSGGPRARNTTPQRRIRISESGSASSGGAGGALVSQASNGDVGGLDADASPASSPLLSPVGRVMAQGLPGPQPLQASLPTSSAAGAGVSPLVPLPSPSGPTQALSRGPSFAGGAGGGAPALMRGPSAAHRQRSLRVSDSGLSVAGAALSPVGGGGALGRVGSRKAAGGVRASKDGTSRTSEVGCSQQQIVAKATAAAAAAAAAAEAAVKQGQFTKEGLPAVCSKGLSLRGVRRLRARIQQLVAQGWFRQPVTINGEDFEGVDTYEQLTTAQLVYMWVKKVSGNDRLADVPTVPGAGDVGFEDGDVGPPTYFVSHAWKSTVCKLLDTIEGFLSSAADTTCVWLDCVAINQHSETNKAANKADVSAFEHVVRACDGGTLVVIDMKRCNPASRAWCVYEWDYTLHYHGPDGLHMHGMNTEELSQIVKCIDVEKAECLYEPDRAMIKNNIIRHHGSLGAFDTALKLQLTLDPLSYKVDLDQLGRRSKDTKWKWEVVRKWLDKGDSSRAMCILAGAGTGKSSISAAIYQQLLGQRIEEEPGKWRGPITAVHFLEYSDQRRLDPVGIIKSLAFQLAIRVHAASDCILKLETKTVTQLRDVDSAFNTLLKPALASIKEPVVILIDALDEGDPPEQQQADFHGSVMACGNKALTLIVQYLARLPPNVRFMFTSRPDAACGGIPDILRRAFQTVSFLEPWQLRDTGADSVGKVLVFDTVVKECGLDPAVVTAPPARPLAGPAAAAPPAPRASQQGALGGVSGGLLDVYRVYAAVFDSLPQPLSSNHAASLLLQVLMAAQEPLSHSLLQQMGLADELQSLPGWGVLFYMADHHVYLLHKSLSDWLLDEGKSGKKHCVDVKKGHQFLGLHLIKDVLRNASFSSSPLPAYTAKYVVYHLCKAGREASQLLEAALGHWDFMRKVFEAGHGGRVLRALGSMREGERSEYSEDAMRWLRRYMNDFEQSPADMEVITVGPDSSVVRSLKYLEASRRLQLPWLETKEFGGWMGAWPADIAILKGHTNWVMSVAYSPDGKQLATASEDRTAKIWDMASGQCTATLQGHTDSVRSVAFSPDGKTLATGSMDTTALVWDMASGQCTMTLQGHGESVWCVAFSPDGRRLATGSMDNTAKVWDMSSGQCVQTLKGHTKSVRSVQFTKDGRRLVTGSMDNTAKVWQVDNGQCTMTLQGHKDSVWSVALSPDEHMLATGSGDHTAKIWDMASGQCTSTLQGHNKSVLSVSVSPDGKLLATGSGDSLTRVWDMASGQCTATLQGQGQGQSVLSVAFSADGKQLATGSMDHTAKIWDVASGQSAGLLQGHTKALLGVVYSPDGKTMATAGGDHTAKIWDRASGTCKKTLEGHTSWVHAIAYSLDGKMLVTGSEDGFAKVWEVMTGECLATLHGHTKGVRTVSFSPDGKQVATGSFDNTARLWSIGSAQCSGTLKGHSNWVMGVAYSPDGKLLATGSMDGTVKVWDLLNSTFIATLQGHSDGVWSVLFSPDGKRLATCSADGTAKVWDSARMQMDTSNAQHTLKGHHRAVWSVVFTADGSQVVTGSEDNTAKIWDVHTGHCTATLKGGTNSFLSLAVSPDGAQIASANGDNTCKIWERASGQSTATLQGHSHAVLAVALSPDAAQLVTGSGDNTAKIWDMASGQCTSTLQGHSGPVSCVAFSPDGAQVATCSEDNTAKVWDLATGKCSATLQGHGKPVWSVAFSPDGKQLATGGDDNIARIWDLSGQQRPVLLQAHSKPVRCVAFSSDGKSLATGSEDSTAKVWDIALVKCTRTLQVSRHSRPVLSVAFSPDSLLLATGCGDNTVKLWDIDKGQCTHALNGHTRPVLSLVFSPDGQQVVSGGADNVVRIWSVEGGTCERTLQGHSKTVWSVAVSSSGRQVVTGSGDCTVKVWDLASGQCTQTLKGVSQSVWSVGFSPDGKRMATGSYENVAKVWDLASGQCTVTLEGHAKSVISVTFSPDGKQIATGSMDTTVKIWEGASGRCLNTLTGHSKPVLSVAYSPDGAQLVTGGEDMTARIWDLTSYSCMATLEGDSPFTGLMFVDSPNPSPMASNKKLKRLITYGSQAFKTWDLGSGKFEPCSPARSGTLRPRRQ